MTPYRESQAGASGAADQLQGAPRMSLQAGDSHEIILLWYICVRFTEAQQAAQKCPFHLLPIQHQAFSSLDIYKHIHFTSWQMNAALFLHARPSVTKYKITATPMRKDTIPAQDLDMHLKGAITAEIEMHA